MNAPRRPRASPAACAAQCAARSAALAWRCAGCRRYILPSRVGHPFRQDDTRYLDDTLSLSGGPLGGGPPTGTATRDGILKSTVPHNKKNQNIQNTQTSTATGWAHSLYLALVLAGSSLAGPRLRLGPPAVPAAATFSPTFLKNCDDLVKSLRTSLRCFSPFLGFSKLPVLTSPLRLASARSRSTWGGVRVGVRVGVSGQWSVVSGQWSVVSGQGWG